MADKDRLATPLDSHAGADFNGTDIDLSRGVGLDILRGDICMVSGLMWEGPVVCVDGMLSGESGGDVSHLRHGHGSDELDGNETSRRGVHETSATEHHVCERTLRRVSEGGQRVVVGVIIRREGSIVGRAPGTCKITTDIRAEMPRRSITEWHFF